MKIVALFQITVIGKNTAGVENNNKWLLKESDAHMTVSAKKNSLISRSISNTVMLWGLSTKLIWKTSGTLKIKIYTLSKNQSRHVY